jgi:tricorn protease
VAGILTAASAAASLVLATPPALALEECRLLRQPDIQGDRIVFVYGGDLWTVARSGGAASRLTTHEGIERFPKFSPDGRTIAMTAEYDGNTDAFVVPADGGEPVRLTWHPDADTVAEWYPDGRSILVRSPRASAPRRYDRFFRVPAAGGFEEMLPLPTGGYASFSPDGGRIAFVSPSYDQRTWKRYTGGAAPDIWVYDFARNAAEKITDWKGPDEWPMWHGRTIYYASDREGRTVNLWAYDLDAKSHRQVTQFTEFDVKWPSIGGDAIVFENGGYLYVMDLPATTGKAGGSGAQAEGRPVRIRVLVPDDRPATRPEYRNVAQWTGGWDLSPSAKRAVIEARGDLFTVPAEKGDARNLTRTPGARERDPAWSPDGKWIAYLSDQSGEYEIHVIGSDGKTPDRRVTTTRDGATFRFRPRWSPDSRKIAFSDKTYTLWWCEVATGRLTRVDKSEDAQIRDYVWSGDSRFIAYTSVGANLLQSVRLYALETGRVTPISTGLYDDFGPAFDPEGRYLYLISRRSLNPIFGAFETDFQFPETDKIYAVTLRAGAASPTAPQSDEETGEAGAAKGEESKDGASGPGGAKGAGAKDKPKGKAADETGAGAKPWTIDLAGIGSRLAEIPVASGRYGGLTAFKGKLVYQQFGPLGAEEINDPAAATGSIHVYDLEKREDKTVIQGVEPGYAASKDGGKLLYKAKETFGIIDIAEGKKAGDGAIGAGTLSALVAPRLEWMQMFDEAWRLERDFYYDPGMGGIDWKAIGERYRQLVPHVAHRADLNYILGELIAELSTSHTYVGGGDQPQPPKVDVGLLGADYDLDARSGLYRFRTIYRERDWNGPVAAPLGEPGVEVREGDYLIAVNGRPLKAPENLYAAFAGTAGRQTAITVGSSPDDPKPRAYTVKPIDQEGSLRYTAWVAANREAVAKATGGRIAYIHVPDTSIRGMQEFAKQFFPQIDKDGIIVDERYNAGGFVPDFYINRLRQTTWTYWSSRDGHDLRTPQIAIDGPKCILINEYAGSGGDAFPYYFKLQGLGPIIGKRTWGGLVGISQSLPLVDGGEVTMPDFGVWDPKTGSWIIENHGVDPDIEVENAPDALVAGHDPQLERAIRYSLEQLQANPPKKPLRPKYKVRS